MRKVKFVTPIACIIVGLIFTVMSLTGYEVYHPTKGPMAGFMPLILGVLLVIVGAADLIQAKNYKDTILEKENWIFVVCVIITIGCSYIIGLLPAGFIFSFLWLKLWSKCTWKETILTMIFLLVVILGVFVYWLKIPFHYGILESFLK